MTDRMFYDDQYGGYINYGRKNEIEKCRYRVTHEVLNSIAEGEKLLRKYRNRGLTKDTRATVNTVLDNRTLIIIKKLKEKLLNDMYGVVSAGKEAFVFSAHKKLNEEEIKGIKEIARKLIEIVQRGNQNITDINRNTERKEKENGKEGKQIESKNGNIFFINEGISHEEKSYIEEERKQKKKEITEENAEEEPEENAEEEEEEEEETEENAEEEEEEEEEEETEENAEEEEEEEETEENAEENAEEIKDIKNEIEKLGTWHCEDFDIIETLNTIKYGDEKINLKILEEIKNKISISLAVKIYNTSVLVFKNRSTYVEGEFRFRNAYTKNKNPRKMVKQWAEKEFRNLRRIIISGLRCPFPIVLKGNVVVMSMIGNLNNASFRIKDIHLDVIKWKELYIEAICILRLLYNQCKLVHADFSEYNLLYFYEHLFIIDVSQAMENDHPAALELLKRDCINTNNFFKNKLMRIDEEKEETKEIKETEETEKREDKEKREDIEKTEDIRKKENKKTIESKKNELQNLPYKDKQNIYKGINILPLKKLFDFIVCPTLPQEVTDFLEKKKEENVLLNYAEIMYIKIYELLENCSMPVAKLKIEDIETNRVYFEKLKEATAYYVTIFCEKKEMKDKKKNPKKNYKEEMEEMLFLKSWVPSYLNEITDIAVIEKDMKLAKKGKSIATHFLVGAEDAAKKGKGRKLKKETNIDKKMKQEEKRKQKENDEKKYKCANELNPNQENFHQENKQKEHNFISLAKVNFESKEKEKEKENIGNSKGIQYDIISLDEKQGNVSEENDENIKEYSEDEEKAKHSEHSECDKTDDSEEHAEKFTGVIPEGIGRKEWKKMVKELNREKRKYKKPKYLKRVKNKKKTNTRK